MEAEDKSKKCIGKHSIESKKGERGLLSSNKANGRSPFLDVKKYIFSEETVNAFSELGHVLRRIRRRLESEGINIYEEDHTREN